MTGKENTEEEVELAPAEDNLWYKFLLKSIELDQGEEKPHGWHWFWGIYGVNKDNPQFLTGALIINLNEIKKNIPKSHWLNSTTSSTGTGKPVDSLKQESASILQSLLLEHGYPGLPHEIDFSKLRFKDQIYFSNFIFPMSVNFIYSEFPDYVEFNNAFFYRSVDFIVTKFSSRSSFDNARFLSNVNFSKATFSSNTSFNNVIFSDDANFSRVNFSKYVFFTRVNFLRAANFHETNFSDLADFSNATFSIMANFDSATFAYIARFYEVKITGHTTFKNAEFKQHPPRFQKADLYSDIIWDESRWPILNKKSHPTVVGQSKNSYENLASLMKSLDKYHDEHFFYRKEMQCRGWLASYKTKFFYWLYEKLADYGYGIEPAFRYWRWHMYVGAVIIAIISLTNSWLECWKDGYWEITKSILCAVPVSFSNAHRFLFFKDGAFNGCYGYFTDNLFFNIIWGFQTVIGIILLFLLLLTLRIRFRLK